MAVRSAWLFAALAVLLAPRHALAQAKPQPATEPEIQCETQEYDRPSHRFKCVGHVEFIDRDMKLYADELEWFQNEDRVVAIGNVVFTQGKNQIAADRAEFDTETRLGTFYAARGVAPMQPVRHTAPRPGGFIPPPSTHEDSEVHFVGDVIEKVGPRKYKIRNGGFTTCLQPTPRWNFDADTITLNIDDYTLLRNAIFSVKGVPLLYTPFLYYPTKKEDRATGFLLPTYGVTSLRGQAISNAFFWAIDRSQDATFMHDWFSTTGQGFGGEYRYALDSGSAAVEAYLLKDNETTYSTGVLPASTSFHIRGSGTQMLPGRLRSSFRVDYPTNFQTAQTFTTNIYDISRYQRTYGANVIRGWRYYSLNSTFERTEYFTSGTENSNLIGSSPRIMFSGSERPLFGRSGLYGSFTSEFSHLDRQTRLRGEVVENGDQGVTRFDVAPMLRYPFREWQWLTVNSAISWRQTAYSRSLEPLTGVVLDEGLNRQIVTLQADAIGPVFNRIWDTPNNGYAEKFKHTVEPFLSVRRVSSFDERSRIIVLDSTDAIVGGTTTYTYGVNNRFYARRRMGQITLPQQIASLEISQSFYTNAAASQFDPTYNSSFGGAPPSTFSPVKINSRFTPTTTFNASVRAELDSRERELRTLSADTTWIWRSGSITTGWQQSFFIEGLPPFDNRDFLRRFLTMASTIRTPENRFGGSYSVYYDAAQRRMQQQTFSGYYNAQCCGVAIQYQRYNYGPFMAPIPFDRRFFISFSLAGLGSFSPFNGALGGLPR
jgi:LPS-assembly protein